MSGFKLTQNNRKQVSEACTKSIANALEICGGKAETYAKQNCPVDTGRLRNSIGHKVDKEKQTAYIGTNVEYAPFVEFGTGIYYNGGTGGRMSSWSYTNKTGSHVTHGQPAKEYLKKAITEHQSEYRRILKDGLNGKL